MEHEYTDVAQLGLGVGAAITLESASRGIQITALDRDDGWASTLNNHNIKWSGPFYPDRQLAEQMQSAFVSMHPIERRHLEGVGGILLANAVETLAERQRQWREWGIPVQPFLPSALHINSVLGKPKYAAGVYTLDSVINYPAVVKNIRIEAERLGARIIPKATVTHLQCDGNVLTGVVYKKDGQEVLLHCRHCVVALGGCAPEVLATQGVKLPVRRWKSHIVTVEGELVERIMIWIDPVVTIVPYRGCTLFADERRVAAEDGTDHLVVPEMVEALKADVAHCFPSIRWRSLSVLRVHASIKTESELGRIGAATRNMAVFDETFHGISGLTVAFPGKASLMFALAREVSDRMMRAAT